MLLIEALTLFRNELVGGGHSYRFHAQCVMLSIKTVLVMVVPVYDESHMTIRCINQSRSDIRSAEAT